MDLEQLKIYAKENHIPIVRDKTLEKLLEISRKEDVKKILEIGTAVGYSTIAMLKNNASVIMYTIEKDSERFRLAKQNIERAGYLRQTRLFNQDALETLQDLVKSGEKFDLVFLDGAKGQYIKYLPYLKQLLNKKGIIFADNINLLGYVNSDFVPHKHRSMVNNMKKFIEALKNDSELVTTIYNIDDGFSISQKI